MSRDPKKPMPPEFPDPPPWVRVLGRPKLKPKKLSQEQLAVECEERLLALMEAYHIEPTPDGWRDLAVILAVHYHPSFQPDGPKLKRGRPKEGLTWDKYVKYLAIQSSKAKLKSRLDADKLAYPRAKFEERLQKKAAKELQKKWQSAVNSERRRRVDAGELVPTVRNPPGVKRLENIAAEVRATRLPDGTIAVPDIARADVLLTVERVAQKAAERITKRLK